MRKICSIIVLVMLSCISQKSVFVFEEKIQHYISIKNTSYIRQIINDSLELRVDMHLKDVQNALFSDWQLDSLIIIDESKERFMTTLNFRILVKASTSDRVQRIFGIKIKGKWHIFMGEHLILPRSTFKYDKYEPLSWDEISYLAHENFFKRYISFDKKGNAIINEKAFDEDVTPINLAPQQIHKTKDLERMFEMQTEAIHQEVMDSVEYKEIIESISKSKRPEDYKVKTILWWDRFTGKKEPIFETKEWKEYIKNKKRKMSEQ